MPSKTTKAAATKTAPKTTKTAPRAKAAATKTGEPITDEVQDGSAAAGPIASKTNDSNVNATAPAGEANPDPEPGDVDTSEDQDEAKPSAADLKESADSYTKVFRIGGDGGPEVEPVLPVGFDEDTYKIAVLRELIAHGWRQDGDVSLKGVERLTPEVLDITYTVPVKAAAGTPAETAPGLTDGEAEAQADGENVNPE